MIRSIKRAVRGFYTDNFLEKQDSFHANVFQKVEPFTMTGHFRIAALIDAVKYVVKHDIPGDIVECGVWRGGSMMAVAYTLLEMNAHRKLHLFDTFTGLTEPTEVDRDTRGNSAASLLKKAKSPKSWNRAICALDDVKQNLLGTSYPQDLVEFVEGKVEDTVPARAPEQVSLLRLDTDWYESTYHELVHLYPRLSTGGVLIIDDYGHWEGARRAVDQFIEEKQLKVLLSRIDYTGRICVKVD